VGLADDFLDDARELAERSYADRRSSHMRRAISTAYYAIFHLFVEDFVEHWEFEDQRARLGRMFNHGPMRNAAYTPKKKSDPTPLEKELVDVSNSFEQLQKDRQKADYDSGWKVVETDVRNSVTPAEEVFTKWRKIKGESLTRYHLLSMFGAKSD
jgi:uncharacterized protein (UPF0332 family)